MGGLRAAVFVHRERLMPFAVAVDIGGTFNDLVAYEHDTH